MQTDKPHEPWTDDEMRAFLKILRAQLAEAKQFLARWEQRRATKH
jgi:hypothetical protein